MQPVPVCLVAYMVGTLWGGYWPSGVFPTFFWGAAVLSAFCGFLLRNNRRAGLICLLLTFLLVGLLRTPLHLSPVVDNSLIHSYCGPEPVIVEGKVFRVDRRGPEKSSVDIDAQLVSSQGIATEVDGRMRLYLGSRPSGLLHGDRVRFRSRLRLPRVFGTPGEFNLPRHLAYSGIRVTAYLADAQAIVKLGRADNSLLRQLAQWKLRCGQLIDRRVSAAIAPLVRALTLGERGDISASQRQVLSRSGVAHLFAISGLHMGLLALFGYQLLLWCYRRSPRLLRWQPPQRVLPLILLPLLFVYLLLTGDAISARRAFLVCFCAAVLLIWRRRVAPLQILATLALLFLLLEPLVLWQASFQLSFAGVAGILCWRRYWQFSGCGMPQLLKKFLQVILITVAANLATMPLVLLNFNFISAAGLINNLFAIPLVTLLAVPLGLAGVLLAGCCPLLAESAFAACGQVLQLTLGLAERVTDIPGLGGTQMYLSQWYLAIVALAVVVLFLPWRRYAVLGGLSLLLLGVLACADPTISKAPLALTAFSVGQGESMLLSLQGRRHILIDGGGLYSDTFDVGERLLAPALGRLGVKQLDAVLLTHDHPDHRKGLLYILERVPVKEFWYSAEPNGLNSQLRQVLQRHGIPVRTFDSGWTEIATTVPDLQLSCYVPELVNTRPNDRSVVLYSRYGETGLLLTGDLEQDGTEGLLEEDLPGSVSLLKLPHHGSRNSGSKLLLRKLKPQLALVSVGYENHYRFPSTDVVEELLKQNATLYRTDLHGTVRFSSNGRWWLVEQWKNGLFR